MGTRTVVAVLAASALALPLAAQSPAAGPARVGILAGINSATVGGDDADDAERITGLVAGVYLVKPIGGGFALRPELLYSQKGAEAPLDEEDAMNTKAKLKLAYLDVPVLLQYEGTGSSTVRPNLYLGPSFGFKTSCEVEGSGEGVAVSIDCDEAEIDIKSLDVGGVIGGGIVFPLGTIDATLGARYQHGFTDLDADASVKNRVLSFYLGLEFGRKR